MSTLQEVINNGNILNKDNDIITDFHNLNIGANTDNFKIQINSRKVVIGDNQFNNGNGNNITVDDNNDNIFIGKEGGDVGIILDTGAIPQIKLKSGSFPVILSTQELTSDVNRTYIDVSGKEVVTVLDESINGILNASYNVDYTPKNYGDVKKFEITPYLKINNIVGVLTIIVFISWTDEDNILQNLPIFSIVPSINKEFNQIGTYLFPSTIINASCNEINKIVINYEVQNVGLGEFNYNIATTIKQLN